MESNTFWQIKLIFCFLGTGAFVFSPPLQTFYLKNQAHNFVQLNFVLKKNLKEMFAPSPVAFVFFFQKLPEKQNIILFGLTSGTYCYRSSNVPSPY